MMRFRNVGSAAFIALGLLFFLQCSLVADEVPAGYFEMSLEQLLDVPVVSASRMAQKSTQLAIPVSVITAEEIHASGLTTIPEILQLAPGVDVRRVDRYRYIVGVRGMAGHSSDRALVLVNGRNAMNPTWGTPEWLLLPVLVEDIERIEILRGPGGAAWGANAFTGMINIITKHPDEDPGNLLSTTVNEFGDTYNHLRFAGTREKWSWRISAGYENLEDSDAAGAGRMVSQQPAAINSLMGFGNFRARDFSRTSRFDTEFRYDYSDVTKLSFGAAYASSEAGDRESVGYYPMKDVLSSMTRLFARADHQFDDDTSGYLQWFGNYSVLHQPYFTSRTASYENNLEAQYNTNLSETHSLTVGGNLRWAHLSSENSEIGEIVFGEGSYDEYWAGLFVIDRMNLTDRLSLENQARIDYYSGTQSDWSLRCAAMYALDEDQNHVLRAGFARAFRSAGAVLRDTTFSSLQIGPGTYMYNLIPSPKDVSNESTYALEAGYTGKFSDHITLQVNSYYQRMEHLIGTVTQIAGPVVTSYLANRDGANTYGAECELGYKTKRYQFAGWYSYNEFVTDKSDQLIRAFFPARHKAGLRGRYSLDEKWSLAANYIYNDAIHINASNSPLDDAAMFNRLDVTLARTFADRRGEFMVGVVDVLNKTRETVYDVSSLTSYETPGRMFFARLQYRF